MYEKKKFIVIMSMKPLHYNCEIYDPWVRGSYPRLGSILPYGENVFNLKNLYLYFVYCIFE